MPDTTDTTGTVGTAGTAVDRIRLSGIAATGYHGVLDHERRDGQQFVADVVLHLDTRAAAEVDRLELTVDYGALAEDVAAVLAGPPADLIETVAERIAAVVLERDHVAAVDVVLHKPQAPITVPFADVTVEIHRDRRHLPSVSRRVRHVADALPVVPGGAAPGVTLSEVGAHSVPVPASVPEPAHDAVPEPAQEPAPEAAPTVGITSPSAPLTALASPLVGSPAIAPPSVAPPVPAPIAAPPVAPLTPPAPTPVPAPTPAPTLAPTLTPADLLAPVSAAPPTPAAQTAPVDRMDVVPAGPVESVIALGSNLGASQDILRDAVAALRGTPGIALRVVAPLARTAPVGGPDQQDYLNTVVVVDTTLSPRALLHVCQDLEERFGRVREERWGPRTLDVDVITHGTTLGVADDLELPHPRAHERAFVLIPWAHVDPGAVLPGLGGGPVAVLAETAPDRDGIRWMALDWWGAEARP